MAALLFSDECQTSSLPQTFHFLNIGFLLFKKPPNKNKGVRGNNLPLPAELKKRKPNKGMEGLTLTPDGKYLGPAPPAT
ncbi:esterase-like activity of phytase family protein [Pararobbsia alpina]|nr:esterase-like activity of phytase family protein [Pararobbsia alpina]